MSEENEGGRIQHVARSGDTHVIDPGKPNAEAVNVDAKAREEAVKAAAKAESADPLDHDGDGRKGGIKGAAPKAE